MVDFVRVLSGLVRPTSIALPPIQPRVVANNLFRTEPYGGSGRVYGTVKYKGNPDTPVRRQVVLIDEKTGTLMRKVFSDAGTGAYSFDGVALDRTYTVLAYDYTGAFRAVVADNQFAVRM